MKQGLCAFAELMTDISRPLLKKRGFTNAAILQHWDEIVGDEMKSGVYPDKITYGKNGGVLHLRVASGAFAMLVEHRREILLDRLAAFNGHKSITAIKVLQGEIRLPEVNKKSIPMRFLTNDEEHSLESKTQTIEQKDLRVAVASLGKSILLK